MLEAGSNSRRRSLRNAAVAVAAAELGGVADTTFEIEFPDSGKDKSPCRLVYSVASLPLGTPVELEVIFEVAA
ncbi:MAG TPA: hypothetical protein VK699_10900 [Terriglobales bacterium]|jgi:hypothetical protein|nr:hypothetical protein [Terriglobales bacterium]